MRLGLIIDDKTFRRKIGFVPSVKYIFSKEAWKTASVVHDELMSNLRIILLIMSLSRIQKR